MESLVVKRNNWSPPGLLTALACTRWMCSGAITSRPMTILDLSLHFLMLLIRGRTVMIHDIISIIKSEIDICSMSSRALPSQLHKKPRFMPKRLLLHGFRV